MLSDVTVVDLSAPLDAVTTLWPGTPPMQARVLDTHEGSGSYSRWVSLPEHAGTHLDAPCHYAPDGADVAAIPVTQLVRPLAVVDLSQRAARDADATLGAEDVQAWEAAHGRLEPGTAVFLRTGWDARRRDAAAYLGGSSEQDLHFPGFGVDGARLLVTERGVVGLGTDTVSIDPGAALDMPVHREVALPAGVWQVENLVGLDRLPATGAWVVVGVPRIVDGSGFPARVIALVP